MPDGDIRIAPGGAADVDGLRDLFLAMHRHHRTFVQLPLVADDDAWRARRTQYLAWFEEGCARLFVATGDAGPVGYAFVVVHDGTDDTFPLAPRYVEVYTLSVAEELRGSGIGGRLLDAVDAAFGELPLAISVMTDNDAALRFYERRGLAPAEIVLFRFPPSASR